ncbi:DUF4194 domain-containing protein [Pelagibaculum spongiae]|uniref:DUF4194 domain-containing protein n=1 Tax=Pelagibaculum spongiae TaxID=2080658 RepID=A0A2V1H6Y6_9GAMM|nr:DUF4194 domain-containing protein [Pelagibaculum spongiae]PVZ72545.1 hypothetical protein DC094_05985 [Pelagibaculum spongiae]
MLSQYLEQQLQSRQLELNDFRVVTQRLLDFGVLCRDENLTEQQLYDQYLRMRDLVDDYMALVGVRLQHDGRFNTVRLFPPNARIPGEEDQEQPFSGMRARLSQNEVAVVLVLRNQYEQLLREGKIDEQGCAALSLEQLSIALKSLLGRSLPIKAVERAELFRRLRRLRVIHYRNEEDQFGTDVWFRIRPMITSMVPPQVMDELMGRTDEDSPVELEQSLDDNMPVEQQEEDVAINVTNSDDSSEIEPIASPDQSAE